MYDLSLMDLKKQTKKHTHLRYLRTHHSIFGQIWKELFSTNKTSRTNVCRVAKLWDWVTPD